VKEEVVDDLEATLELVIVTREDGVDGVKAALEASMAQAMAVVNMNFMMVG